MHDIGEFTEAPLTFGQEALWILHKKCSDTGIYNCIYAWTLPFDIDITSLKQAIGAAVDRHPALRSLFKTNAEGKPRQYIYTSLKPCITDIETGDLNPEELNDLLVQDLHQPFDFDNEPPIRWLIYRLPNGKHVLSNHIHHIIMDMWSCVSLMTDINLAYAAFHKGEPLNQAPLELTMGDFAKEQHNFVESEAGGEMLKAWNDQLSGMNETLDISTDYKRLPQMTCNKKRHQFELNAVTQKLFHDLAGEHKLSLFSQYLALYHLLLYKYSNQSDILVGTPTAGRDDRFKGVYGYFVNPVIVRAQIRDHESVLSFFKKQFEVSKFAISSSALPLPVIANEVITNRDPSRAPLFQASFAWENINRFEHRDHALVTRSSSAREVWDLSAIGALERHPIIQQLDDFDITLKIHKIGNEIYGGFEYNSDLFDQSTIVRMAESYQALMHACVTHPDQSLARISGLSNEDRYKQLKVWNSPQKTLNRLDNILEVFESIVSQFPQQLAVEADNEQLTYKELDERSNQLAHYLRQQGVGKNNIIGIALARTSYIPIALLAVFKAGCAYLPLDPDYPKDRLQHMLSDSNTRIIITDNQSQPNFQSDAIELICIDSASEAIASHSSGPLGTELSENQLAYVIYTSGSTGKPKGVAVEHHSLSNLLVSQKRVFTLSTEDRILLFASLNFDASLFAFTLSLLSGTCLYITRKENILGENLPNYINRHAISWVLLPPTVVNSLDPTSVKSLKNLVVGGEACTPEFAKKWSDGRRLYNAYGPTEATVWATSAILNNLDTAPIGKPVANTQVYILDQHQSLLPIGVPGEIYIGGQGLARGYLNQPELTKEKFLELTIDGENPERVYKTGDIGRYLPDGNVEFLGRIDHQVKIRGYRIELGEIETILQAHTSVHDVLVVANESTINPLLGKQLTAYVVKNVSENLQIDTLRNYLRATLPEYMVPSAFVILDAFPLTPNGKIDRKALPIPQLGIGSSTNSTSTPRNEIEFQLATVWQNILGISNVSIDENFFDLGGNSLLLAQVHSRLADNIKMKASMVDLFKYPTIKSLAHFLENDEEEDEFFVKPDSHMVRLRYRRHAMAQISGVKIAIVGMAGRFPGAETVDQLWSNICDKKESITFFNHQELLASHEPLNIINHPNYVPAKGLLNHLSSFDAEFFNFTPREAQITDPQQRVFLECAWEALEDAGCVPSKFDGAIGVYAGVGINNYMLSHLATNPELWHAVGDYPIMIGNDKDFLSTRVSYKLNLNGPAMVLQTACSSSLVAVHTACQALIHGECDAALAGGVSFGRLGKAGYLYKEGMIMSPDGHCRAFDADAKGTVQGQGAGLVLLKRLDDAIQNNDQIYAVIKGSATNNDGSNKPGYTAPSVQGQAKAIMMAQASANTEASKISYIEAHGTGTPLGDPIEIEALRQSFSASSTKFCAIGSLKTNIGHLDAASGIAGLIKTAKALQTKTLPPTLHFRKPNPKINFEKSPFYVNTETKPWEISKGYRNAGVSSFGIGGTNAHVVLTEYIDVGQADMSRPWQILSLSAKTEQALETMTLRFLEHIKSHPNINFADACYTLHVGRDDFEYRRYLVCRNRDEAIAELENRNPKNVITSRYQKKPNQIAFLFSGQGSQYISMGKHLYRVEVLFRDIVNDCQRIIGSRFVHIFEELDDVDFKALSEKVHQTNITQPTLFVFEYALAKLLISWGIKPDVMMGHSIGEYVAACLAGVFTLEQALELVTIRGHLIYELEEGDMLSVNLPEADVRKYLTDNISLAAVNGQARCVLSGNSNAIEALQEKLKQDEIQHRVLHTSHAFHSHMMDPILERFKGYVKRRNPQPPTTPFISCLTGDFITDDEATSADYWANHLRQEVRFHRGLETLLNHRNSDSQCWTILEVGPGNTLSTLTKQHASLRSNDLVIATTRHPYDTITDTHHLLNKIAKLWQNGIRIDWDIFHENRQRARISLPTYPFDKTSYWIRARHLNSVDPNPNFQLLENEHRSVTEPESEAVEREIIAPRNATEENILAHWQATLGIHQISVFDNYFDLGGDSLLAVNLVDNLITEFNIPIATHVLIQQPTIAELAEFIDSSTQNISQDGGDEIDIGGSSPLVLIQRGKSDRKPLFMVHPIGGEVFFYRDLARHLGKDQPVYAFQAPSLSGKAAPFSSIPEMAEAYLSELKRIDANPPYMLGGSSFGGLVAYEMAQQLLSYREEVRLLVMIDTPAPNDMPTHITDSAAILQYLLKDQLDLPLEKLRKLDEKSQIDYVLEEARLSNKAHVLPSHLGVPLFSTWIAHQNATYKYKPEPYQGDVIFFRHTEPMEHFPALPHRAWMELVNGKLEIHQVPGDHISMNYPPCVQVLAAHLKLTIMSSF